MSEQSTTWRTETLPLIIKPKDIYTLPDYLCVVYINIQRIFNLATCFFSFLWHKQEECALFGWHYVRRNLHLSCLGAPCGAVQLNCEEREETLKGLPVVLHKILSTTTKSLRRLLCAFMWGWEERCWQEILTVSSLKGDQPCKSNVQ